jgi:AcrR family transcriptional regulator
MMNTDALPPENTPKGETEEIKTHRPWQRKKEIRPQEILAAALDVFVEQGFSATKVAEVARRAGVQPGTIYVYFENKEALFKAVIHAAMSPVLSYSNEFLDNYTGTPEKLLYELTHQWWNLMESESCAGIPKLITAEANNFPELTQFYIDQVLVHAKRIVERVLQYGIDRNQFFIEDMDVTARIIMMFFMK